MNQDQQPRPWWEDNRLVWAVTALTLISLGTITTLGHLQRWVWTELLWRWLELLIIPILLGAGAFWFNQQARKGEQQQRENELEIADQQRRNELEIADQQRRNELEIADQQRKEDSLQRYLDRMQELILDKGLKRSEKDAEIRSVARARTIAALRDLDGDRKGQLMRFLYEAGLITRKAVGEKSGERQITRVIIDLRDADLRGTNLRDADLSFSYLDHADLSNADLSNANLRGAHLRHTNLSHADLIYANLSQAILTDANLNSSNLRFTDLSTANLSQAILTNANLNSSDLHFADLSNASRSHAILIYTNLSSTKLGIVELSNADLRGANLCGTNLTDADRLGTYLR